MSILLKNNCISQLAAGITSVQTQFYITSTDGTFPSVSAGSQNYFIATIANPNTGEEEIVKVISCNPKTGLINCERAQEGTTAKSFPVMSTFECRITAGVFQAATGASGVVPRFEWRMETAGALPKGYIACDGASYSKDTTAGKVLANLGVGTKNSWGMQETATMITAPNFYTANNQSYSVIPGKNPGTKASSTLSANTSSATAIYTFYTIQMTPALYVGV